MFQLELLPNSENLLLNGSFQNDISSWNTLITFWQWASGRLQGEKVITNNPAIFQSQTVTANRTYQLNLTAQFTNLTSSLTVSILNGTGTSTNNITYSAADYGTQPFNITQYWDSLDGTSVFVTFILDGEMRDLVFIDDVSFYELTEPAVTLETCEGVFIKTIPVFARANNVISYAVEWFGIPEGCYRVCMTGVDDTEKNYLDDALALSTEGDEPIELEQGGNLKWFG